ncbi:GNAT family N-acetyltransferase [Micromonospora tulbaghiae]|uniref:GNAT family N-acetyltransferase n=1 Tax=Micromonospora tulbaghiae TaxID=479978 RepID=UPI00332CBE3B
MLHEDWTDTITVPYVPTIGPVHPDSVVEVFRAVLASRPGEFLPYDKERRWADRKDERVLPGELEQRPDRTAVATLARRRGGRVTVYEYGPAVDVAAARARAATLAARHGAASAHVVWPGPAPVAEGRAVRVLLAPTARPGPDPDRPVLHLADLPAEVRATFSGFCAAAGPGMAHLGRRWAADDVDAPILVTVAGGRVVGAIGPMQVAPGPDGALQLLPQYLAVDPQRRRGGHGRALWRAGQRWGRTAGAAYQLLQVEAGSPAAGLYASEGVGDLGAVCTVIA